MPIAPSLLTGPRGASGPVRAAMFTAWLLVAGWLAWNHVLWRDEVRAFSIALNGATWPDMLRGLHGEGHPALWYLLLRAAHDLFGVRQVLPGLAFTVGAGTAALFAWRAPFRPAVLALALFGAFFVHEYTVVARNYGISMALMFAFAALYPRWKGRGVGLGLILALLANTNAPSVLLAGALALFWGVELLTTEGLRWSPAWRGWCIGVGLMLAGVAGCVLAIYPPANDAVVSPAGRLTAGAVFAALFNLSTPMSTLVPEGWWVGPLATVALAAMLVGGPLGLLRSPGGLAAASAILLSFPLFFQLVYPGAYRHEALYVVLLLTLHWLAATGQGGRWPDRAPAIRPATQAWAARLGQAATIALLLAQVALTGGPVEAALAGRPYSHSRDLADLLRREHLGNAVVMADVDIILEPLPYYLDNPIWLLRSRRWGHVVPFTRANAGLLHYSDVLATARALHARTRRPVVIVAMVPLDLARPPKTWSAGYVGTITTSPAELRAFFAATRRLASFGPAVTDEYYDVFLLR